MTTKTTHQTTRILSYIRENGPVSLQEIAEACDVPATANHIPSSYVSQIISANKLRGTDEWRNVERVARGTYIYHESAPSKKPSGWTVITESGDNVVLTSPTGRVYVAKPLARV